MKFNDVIYFLSESIIDYPQFTLDKQVWDLTDKDHPKLRNEVKEKINNLLSKFPYFDLPNLIEEIRIVGSICTNQYLPNSDIDVHMSPKMDVLNDIFAQTNSYKNKEDLVVGVKKYFLTEYEPHEEIFVGKHPLEFYIQLNIKQDYYSEGVYIVNTDEWKIGPRIYDMSFDPLNYYKNLLNDVNELNKNFDLQLGNLKRNVIDYNIIKEHIKAIPAEYRQQFKEKLEEKLQHIEEDIKRLALSKKDIIELRHNSSKGDFDKTKFNEINVKFKFIDRYHYFKIIRELEELIKDDQKLSHNEVKDIKV